MADSSGENIGGINVSITGDYSPLQAAFSTAQDLASQAGGNIADALTQGAASAGSIGDEIAGQLGQITPAADGAAGSLQGFAGSAGDAGEAAGASTSSLAEMAEKLTAIGEALVITEGLKEFGTEALSAADSVTTASISLTKLTGDAGAAEETMRGLDELGTSDGLSMPALRTAATRMTALLPEGTDVVAVLGQIADGAAVTGTSIEQAANRFDMIVNAGTLSARALTSMGLSLTAVTAAMNQLDPALQVTEQHATAAFKALDPGDRIQVLQTALQGLGGTAQQVAEQTFGGQWQQLANAWEEVMVQVGQAILPVISDLISITKTDIIPFVRELTSDFSSLPGPVKDFVVAMGLAAAAIIPVTGGLAAVGLAVSGLEGLMPALSGIMASLGATTTAVATEETAQAVATGEIATAAATAVPEIEALAVSEQQLSLSFAENLGAAGLVGEQLSLELVPAVEAAGTGLAAFTTDVGAAGLGLMALGPTAALAVLSAASLKDGWNQAKETLDNVIGTAEQIPGVFKAVADSGGIVGTVATDVKSAWSGLLSVFEQYNTYSLAAQGINKITDAVDVLIGVVPQASVLTSAMNAELSKLQNSGVSAAVAEVSEGLKTLNDSVHKATDQQTLLNQILTDAQTKFQAVSAQYQSGAATAEQYIAAQKSVETATENLTKAQDAQTNAAMNAAIEQAKLDQETQVAIETATQYLDTVSKMPEVQQQELSALQETASVLPPLVAQFAGLDGVISNLQSTMPGFGVQILNLTSGPLAGLQNALAQAAQNVTEWAARMADGENVGVQYEKALQRQLAAQVALDQETAVLNTGLQGATDTISLAKDAVAAAQAKVDDLTQAFQSGLTTYDKVQQAQKQLTSAQTELNKVTGDGKGFVDQLSAAYPQLGSSCDNATGAIGRQTTALQQDAAALQSVASAVQQVESDMAAAFSTQSTSGGTVNVGQGLQLGGGLLTGGGEFGTRQYSYGVYGDASTVAAQAKQQEQLRYDQGYTPEAIAKAMGVPLSQVLTDLGLTAGQAEQAKSQGGVVLSPNQPTSPITTSAGSIPPPGGSSSGGGSTSSPVVSAGGGGTSAIDGGSYPAVTAHQASGEVWAVSGSGVSTSGGGVAGAPITTTVQTTLNQTNSADLSGVTNVVGQVAQQISGFSGGLLPITQNLANIANSLGQVATRVFLGPLSTSGDSSGLPGVVGGSGRVYGGTPLPTEVGGGNPQGPYVPPPASTPPSAPPNYNPFGQTSAPINAQVSIDMRGANVGAQTQSALTQAVTQGLVNALRTAGARF